MDSGFGAQLVSLTGRDDGFSDTEREESFSDLIGIDECAGAEETSPDIIDNHGAGATSSKPPDASTRVEDLIGEHASVITLSTFVPGVLARASIGGAKGDGSESELEGDMEDEVLWICPTPPSEDGKITLPLIKAGVSTVVAAALPVNCRCNSFFFPPVEGQQITAAPRPGGDSTAEGVAALAVNCSERSVISSLPSNPTPPQYPASGKRGGVSDNRRYRFLTRAESTADLLTEVEDSTSGLGNNS